jgi:predicted dehydrogenase
MMTHNLAVRRKQVGEVQSLVGTTAEAPKPYVKGGAAWLRVRSSTALLVPCVLGALLRLSIMGRIAVATGRRLEVAEHVRVGVVGTSWFADGFHLPNLASHPRAEIVAICGRTREPAEELATKYSIPHIFSDYRAMIASGLLDALVVVTPDALHYPITMAALDAGLHVLCEKTLAMSASQAREMYEKAQAGGRKHMVMFTWHWAPHFQYMEQLIEQGFIGRPYHFHCHYEADYGRDGTYGWRFDRKHGHGILGDLGSHAIDCARRYVGDIAKVSGHLATFVERPGFAGQALDAANDSAQLAVEFANGAHGSIHVSAVTNQSGTRVGLYGEAGSLELVFTFTGAELRGMRQGEEAWQTLEVPDALWHDADRTGALIDQIFDLFKRQSVANRMFIDAILDNRPIDSTFYDGWKAQQVIDAAIASHEQGRWITIE